MQFYYNNQTLVKIPDDWTETVKSAQKQLLESQGFKPVSNMTEDVKNDFPFAIRVPTFSLNEDGTSYTMLVKEQYLPVHLSQEKLLRQEAIASKLDELMEALTADDDLKDWWCNSMNYVRHSGVAKKAAAAFGLTEEQMEQIVKACRG